VFVQEIPESVKDYIINAVKSVEKKLGRKLDVLIISDKSDKTSYRFRMPKNYKQIFINTNSVSQIESTLKPYLDKIVGIVCRGEKNLLYFQKIIPQVPYLETPTPESIDWSTNKILMRRRLRHFEKKLAPKYLVVDDYSEATLKKIKTKVGYPCIVKPTGLAASVLVQVCFYQEEAEQALKLSFRKLKSVYRAKGYLGVPSIIVEQFMEGSMYSTDIYVNSRGTMYATPLVKITTGYSVGLKDFFGYKQITPTKLTSHKEQRAIAVAKQSVEALGLRSTTAHVELMKTDEGWKIIETGARTGGFRDFLYSEAYNLDHSQNDILIRLPMRPVIPRHQRKHACVMKIYPKTEGKIASFIGLRKIQRLESVLRVDQNRKVGDKAVFARNGGGSIFNIYLSNKDRSDLLADMRRVEKFLEIEVKKSTIESEKSVVERFKPSDILEAEQNPVK
ncbi:MAG: ATP-grasp domain-containing protein, partial [bacterium]|nr:ATP-grasp domain-containing protein [bacterium]